MARDHSTLKDSQGSSVVVKGGYSERFYFQVLVGLKNKWATGVVQVCRQEEMFSDIN